MTAENALLQYEAGQSVTPMSALTDSGDATTFTSGASLWSGRSGYAQDVKPNGLATGGAVTVAASGDDNAVDVAVLSCYLAGVKTTVAADVDVTITRPATNVAKVCSVTVTSAGAIAVVAGTDGSTTAFSETRGVAGGPPLIPVGSFELRQVRVSTSADAPITAAQIFGVIGLHVERYDYPLWDESSSDGTVTFSSALPLIHTGALPKGVFASYAEPIFSDISLGSDFVPAETSHSVSSKQIYGTTRGASKSSLAQGSFKAILANGVTDALIGLKNETLWFKFYPDRYETGAYLLTQGKLGIKRTFPADDDIMADCTISAASQSIERTE